MRRKEINSQTIIELQRATNVKAYLKKQEAQKAIEDAEYQSGKFAYKNRFSYDMLESYAAHDLLWEIFFHKKSIFKMKRGTLQEVAMDKKLTEMCTQMSDFVKRGHAKECMPMRNERHHKL